MRQRRRVLVAPGTRCGSSASSGTTHGEIDVANDLPRNGPSGTYSKRWMSRALQSLTSTNPKMCSRAALVSIEVPSTLPVPVTKPSSSSMSSRSVGPNRGAPPASAGGSWPRGRRTGVPETTTELGAPW